MYTANQTLYFPPLYMMHRFKACDSLVYMEEAQFTKFGHQSRAQIMGPNGPQMISLPLQKRSFKRLDEIQVDDPSLWAKKLFKTLTTNYGRYPGYRQNFTSLQYDVNTMLEYYSLTLELTAAQVGRILTHWCIRQSGLSIEEYSSQSLVPERPDDASEWVASLGEALGDDAYLGGGTAMQNYVRYDAFQNRGITLHAQDFTFQGYTSVKSREVTDPWTSALDVLMTGGKDLMAELLDDQFCRTQPVYHKDCYA